MKRRAFALMIAPLMLAGCSLAPKTVLPAPPVPQSWPVGDSALLASEQALPILSYREIFTDARLQILIDQALAENRDLRVAYANVKAARAQAQVTRSAIFPDLGISGGGTRFGGDGPDRSDFNLRGGITSFELDFFGRLSNAAAADLNAALATEAASRTIRLVLISELASAWASYGANQDLLKIAEDTAVNARESVRLTQARLDGGIAPRTDLRQAEQILATAEDSIAQQRALLMQDENLLRLLLGRELDRALLPANLDEAISGIALPPAGTRSEILLRRPDVVEAEYDLRAANANIGVARARLFPSISLTGLVGFASDALSSLFSSGAWNWSAGANIAAPIFGFGGRQAGVAISEARAEAALANYEGAIQSAFREVADALAVQSTIAERVRAAKMNSDAAEDSARLTEARYRGGIDDFLSSLVAQRSLYAARQNEIRTQLLLANMRINLFRALGGDSGAGQAPASESLATTQP